MAWDGDVKTFYDYYEADGGWTQAELESHSTVAQIDYYPRSGFLERHIGGKFVGIADDGSTVNLIAISKEPTFSWNSLTVSSSKTLTAVRYNAPDGGYGNIAEIRLYMPCGPSPSPAPTPPPSGLCGLQTGELSGVGPAMSGYGGGDYTMAWDGDVKTFYDYSKANGGWTQAKLKNQAAVAKIDYYPRPGFLERHIGGKFVGIGSDGSTVNLITISKQPTLSWNSLIVSSSKTLTAIRYNAPDGGYGNIAEIKLYTACATMV